MKYTGSQLREISFPLGGIGTGCIGLAGNGSFLDWEIFNRPNKGSFMPHSFFAVRASYPDGKTVCKILQGDWTKDLSGQYSKSLYDGFGRGPVSSRMFGFPHFHDVTFDGTFPIAKLTFEDEQFPGTVVLKAFNPFIPLDSENSSIPAAFFDIEIQNSAEAVTYTVLLSMSNPFGDTLNHLVDSDKYTAIHMINAVLPADDLKYGDITAAVDVPNGMYQQYGFRGGAKDAITTFWHDFTTGTLNNRVYDTPGNQDICLVGATARIPAAQSQNFRFVLSWNVPNCHVYWDESRSDLRWKNYYATRFADSTVSCAYALENWDYLYQKTVGFCNALHSSTLDPAVIDAASSTLSVLKSPTVLRLEDGTFYAWEGTHELIGSCEGTCTHVWNYVYSMCFLFPDLEQSLRTFELRYSIREGGYLRYRSSIPNGGDKFDYLPPCLDGQMGTIIKIYRDWKISGDSQWLREHWATVKHLLEYAWSEENHNEWDRNRDGVLEGEQHHTLDMALFGPSSWLEGLYLAALKAGAEMAEFMGEAEKAQEYTALFEKGYQWTKENLFNGSYFIHKIDVTDKSIIDHFNHPEYWNEERKQIKYQIGEGSAIDQMLGQWHATLCGLGDIFDKEQRKIALKSMMKDVFKPSLRDLANPWRIFALNDEGAAVMCAYPEGCNKPLIPIYYCDECMTGFEYAFAGLLISEGFIEEGLTVVRAIRDRYDGAKRNPWNEIECGGNYARAMASFALLPIFSGFTFDLPKHAIGFAPILPGDYRCVWSLGTGWGEFFRTEKEWRIRLESGSLTLEHLTLGGIGTIAAVYADGAPVSFTRDGDTLHFDPVTVTGELRIEATE